MKRLFFTAFVLATGLCLGTSPSPSPAPGPVPDDTVLASAGAKISSTPPEEPPPACPPDMVEVQGEYCPAVEQFCLRQVEPKHPERDRCAEFAATGRCLGTPMPRHFCIDRFEWPNKAGVKPDFAMDWNHAGEQCKAAGKRLCNDSEWTLACEGEERLPYPYGYTRNSEACNIDRPYIMPDDNKWANLKTRGEELVRAATGGRCATAAGR